MEPPALLTYALTPTLSLWERARERDQGYFTIRTESVPVMGVPPVVSPVKVA